MLYRKMAGQITLILLVLLPAASSRINAADTQSCRVQGPDYYSVEQVTTKNIPGTGLARGKADLSVPGNSPFSVSILSDGSYEYSIHISLERMKTPTQGRLVAWVTTREVDEVRRLGTLDENLQVSGKVAWNKFLVVITLEPNQNHEQSMWTGPIVFRGMSRSCMMHTMVGHGALQQENCAAYGYGS